jgi:hypothetical protein
MVHATFMVLMVIIGVSYRISRWILFDAAYELLQRQRTTEQDLEHNIEQIRTQAAQKAQENALQTNKLYTYVRSQMAALSERKSMPDISTPPLKSASPMCTPHENVQSLVQHIIQQLSHDK